MEHLSISSNRQVVECRAGGECAGCHPNGDPNGYNGSVYGANGIIKLKVLGKYSLLHIEPVLSNEVNAFRGIDLVMV